MNKSKLKEEIQTKLEQLEKLLDKVDEIRAINSDEPETWDSDILCNTVEELKAVLQLLEDKKSFKELNEFDEPLILESGLCSLVDEYNSEE